MYKECSNPIFEGKKLDLEAIIPTFREHHAVYRPKDTWFGYCAWPSVCRDENGTLYALSAAFGSEHVCPFNKVAMYISKNGGKTWSPPIVVADTYLPDGHGGITYLGNGKLIISGQSAGAWIASMLCVDKQWLAAVGIDAEEIDAWLIDSAQMSSHFRLLEMEEKITPWLQRIDKYAPLYYIDQGVKVSPMFITYYEKDMLCRVEQNEMFIKALKFFDREADVTGYLLHGGHCHGTSQKDEDGQYEFLKKAVPWMKERGL